MRSLQFLLLSALALVSFMALDQALAGARNEENPLILVETNEDEGETTVIDEATVPDQVDVNKIFLPTKEWQTIEPDAVVLPGLHVRMNLATGLKEAKLLDGDDGEEYMKAVERIKTTGHTGFKQAVLPSQVAEKDEPVEEKKEEEEEDPMAANMRESIIEALKHIKSEDGKSPEELTKEAKENKKKFRSYEELKADFDSLNLKMESDSDILIRLIAGYKTTQTDLERITTLEDLEYLCHNYDNAIAFIDMGGLETIVKPGLNSSSVGVKQGVLHLLGSAVQSNPKVQIAALEAGLLQPVIQAVSHDGPDGTARKAVYALSCLVRGFPYGQQLLLQHGGLEVLRRVFDKNDWQSLPVQLKVVSLIHDLLVERANAEGERLQQLRQVRLDDYVAQGGWCPAVSSLLAAASFDRRDRRYDMGAALRSEMPLRPDHDTVDKVISAMGSMVRVCRYQFLEALPLLKHLALTYSDLAYKELYQDNDDGGQALFRSIADMISGLVKDIGQKSEL